MTCWRVRSVFMDVALEAHVGGMQSSERIERGRYLGMGACTPNLYQNLDAISCIVRAFFPGKYFLNLICEFIKK